MHMTAREWGLGWADLMSMSYARILWLWSHAYQQSLADRRTTAQPSTPGDAGAMAI